MDRSKASARPYDVVCLGETMVMITPTPGGRLSSDSTFVLRAGGAESNVAMYLAGLGHSAAWMSRVGADPLGDLLVGQVAAAGAQPLVERVAGVPTGIYFKDPQPGRTRVYYYRKGSAASSMDPAFGARMSGVDTRIMHLSGITAALSPSCHDLIESLLSGGAEGATISFDVNYRPVLWPDRQRAADDLLRMASAADIVFVGLDEAHALWGATTAEDVRTLIAVPGTLVVKDGAVEATAFHADGRTVVPALSVDVVEPVGAGDAFAAGWLSGALRGLDHEARLRLGHFVAGLALSSLEDFVALPSPAAIGARLALDPALWPSPSDVA